MDTNNKIKRSDTLNNTLRAKNKIKLNMYNGVLNGNIVEDPILLVGCIPDSLMFTCDENSQYIPIL